MFSLIIGIVVAQNYEEQIQNVLSQVVTDKSKLVHAVFEQGVPAMHVDVDDGKPIGNCRVSWFEASVFQTWNFCSFECGSSCQSQKQLTDFRDI